MLKLDKDKFVIRKSNRVQFRSILSVSQRLQELEQPNCYYIKEKRLADNNKLLQQDALPLTRRKQHV